MQGKVLLSSLIDYYVSVNMVKSGGVENVNNEQARRLIDLREKINKLIKSDTDLNYTDDNGNTAIYVASINDDKQILQELIDKKASLKTKTPDGFSLLSNAVSDGKIDAALVLLNNGADPDGFLEEDRKPINIALLKSAMDNVYTGLALRLISLGASVNIKGENEDTLLLSAIKLENSKIAIGAIEAGADVRFVDTRGVSILEWVVVMRQMAVLEAIVKKDPQILKTKEALKAFSLAGITKNDDAFSFFSAKGLRLEQSDRDFLQLSLCQGLSAKKVFSKSEPTSYAKNVYPIAQMNFISLKENSNGVEILTKDKLKKYFFLKKPDRLVFDFYRISGARNFKQTIDSEFIKSIVIGRHQGYYRLVIYLNDKNDYKIKAKENSILILIKKG